MRHHRDQSQTLMDYHLLLQAGSSRQEQLQIDCMRRKRIKDSRCKAENDPYWIISYSTIVPSDSHFNNYKHYIAYYKGKLKYLSLVHGAIKNAGHYLPFKSLGSSVNEEYLLPVLRREDRLLGEVVTCVGSSAWGLRSILAWRVNPELNLQTCTNATSTLLSYHDNMTYLFLRCWTLPRHLKDPLTMIASLVHSASHSSILHNKGISIQWTLNNGHFGA